MADIWVFDVKLSVEAQSRNLFSTSEWKVEQQKNSKVKQISSKIPTILLNPMRDWYRRLFFTFKGYFTDFASFVFMYTAHQRRGYIHILLTNLSISKI